MEKKVFLVRHAEKGDTGLLTEAGRLAAVEFGKNFPDFTHVYSSDSSRAQETAKLITGKDPIVDPRAGFYMASQGKSDALNQIAKEKNIPFLEAVVFMNDPEVLQGIDAKATELNALVKEIIEKLPVGGVAIVVSHDLSISPAMEQKGIPLESIPFLSGYIIDQNGTITSLK